MAGAMPRRKDLKFERQLQAKGKPDDEKGRFPLVHVTAVWPAQEIIKIGKIIPKFCKLFRRELAYFFVMRPAYQSKFGNEASHQISRFPFVFVLRPESVLNPIHVYPFDTGAAASGAFSAQADRFVPLEDYALAANHGAISRFIMWAFRTPERYFDGYLDTDLVSKTAPAESVVVSYFDIARMGFEGSNIHDERASAIEVTSDHNVELDRLLLIIYPKQLLDGNKLLEQRFDELRKNGTEFRSYDWQPNRAPNEFQSDINIICRKWMKRNRHL